MSTVVIIYITGQRTATLSMKFQIISPQSPNRLSAVWPGRREQPPFLSKERLAMSSEDVYAPCLCSRQFSHNFLSSCAVNLPRRSHPNSIPRCGYHHEASIPFRFSNLVTGGPDAQYSASDLLDRRQEPLAGQHIAIHRHCMERSVCGCRLLRELSTQGAN